ncbi:MAG: GTPase Era [Polyangiaceae bacterium]|nr:GTPase Era [Polyangiaceae bacterium]
MRFGTVTLVGRPNVGKSTLLNAALGENLAIVSSVPQTTRDTLLGVVQRPAAQIAFIDTPGLHRPRSELGRRMNAAALDALRSAELVVFMTDVAAPGARPGPGAAAANTAEATGPDATRAERSPYQTADRALIALLPKAVHALLVINKVDRLKDKSKLLGTIDGYSSLYPFEAIVPASMRSPDDVERVLTVIEQALPEGAPAYDAETLTNRPVTFFIQEYIREQVLRQTTLEVPHAVAVGIDRIEHGPKLTRIAATLHVEKPGQRKILVGHAGAVIREIGTAARHRIEALIERRAHLELFVRVTPRWRNAPRQLAELGYTPPDDPKLTRVLADAPARRTPKRTSRRGKT